MGKLMDTWDATSYVRIYFHSAQPQKSRMPYWIHAHDHTDADAPQRRLSARETHLAAARDRAEAGILLMAGAILDAEGRMVGSMLVVDLPSEAEVVAWVESDVYWTSRVWARYAVTPVRLAIGGHK